MKTLCEWLAPLKASYEHNTDYAKGRAYEVLLGNSPDWVELSYHGNGYIREIAVAMLAEQLSRQSVKAILIALNDWVANVREQAIKVLNHYLTQDIANQLLANVDTLLALTKRNRTNHQATIDKIKAYLQQTKNKACLAQNFLASRGRYALFIFELLLKADPLLAAKVSREHKDAFIRYVIVKYHRRFEANIAEWLLTQAITDNNGRVRVAALRVLFPKVTDQKYRVILLKSALLHANGALRNWAIWAAKAEQLNIEVIINEGYQQLLPFKQNWLGLLGLIIDTHCIGALAIVREALKSPIIKVRARALVCYRLLDEDTLYPVLITMLQDKSDKIFTYSAKLLAEKYRPEGLSILVQTARELALTKQKSRLFTLLLFVPLWQHLIVILELADLLTIKTSDQLLKRWCSSYSQLIYLPELSSELKIDIIHKLTALPKIDLQLKEKIASYIA